jgi:surfactin synthase thioesterase subunit
MHPLPVLCFPPAGAGASFYGRWQGQSSSLEIIPVDLPGRERRYAEPPHTDLNALVAQLAIELQAVVGETSQLAVFGHSFGAVLAYETLRELLARDMSRHTVLFVSGSAGPGTVRANPIAGLPDAEFLAAVRRITGYSDPALDNLELRELLLPALRADVEMHESYRPVSAEPLTVPVVSIRGSADALVSSEAAAEWQAVTTRELRTTEIHGGHMYLVSSWTSVIELIERTLSAERVEV